MNRIDNYFSNSFSTMNKTNYVSIIVYIVLLWYIACLVYKLPEGVYKLFNNLFIKLAIIAFSAYLIHKDVACGMLFAIAALTTIHFSWTRGEMKKRHFNRMVRQEVAGEVKANIQEQEQIHKAEQEQEHRKEGMETVSIREESVEFKPEMVADIKGEMPTEGCNAKANYHNSFYPQYVNMKPDAYMARYTGDTVGGYDSTATYSKI